jgi:hypothetical protein
MMRTILIAATVGLAAALPAWAKLPVPQLSEEQKVKAEEARQRTAWQGKVTAFQQCQAENTVAEKYARALKAQGKDAKVGDLGTCANPGPFAVAAAVPAPAPAAPTAPAAAAAAPAAPAIKK